MKKLVDNGGNCATDTISPEFKQRIKDALIRANESIKGLNVDELNQLSEEGYKIAREK